MKEVFPDINSLIRSCINNEVDAFRTLVDRYYAFTFSLAFRMINDEDEAKDIVQETFITIWKKLKSFNPNKKFDAWLYRIIVNKCYDYIRKQRKLSLLYPDDMNWNLADLIGENDTDEKLSNKEIGKIIRSLTHKLSAKQKLIFVLSDLEAFSHDDISEITGMSKTTIKSNLNHARRNIGMMLEKYL